MMRNLIGRLEVLTTTFSNNNTFTVEFGYITNSTYYTKFFGENKNKTVFLIGSPTKEQFVLFLVIKSTKNTAAVVVEYKII